jgi:chaperonin cofactor prefoldin
MATPGAFELGRAIGTNVSQGVTQASEQNYLDKVLNEIGQSNDPTQIQNSIGQILSHVSPERQPLAQAVIQNKLSLLQKQKTQQATQAAGMPAGFENLPPTVQAAYIKNKGQKSQIPEKAQPLLTGLDVINRQRELLKGGNIGGKFNIIGTGRDIGSTWSKQGVKDRGEYERAGKSLIALASNIPIRNRLEFETLSEGLYDITKSREELAGSLDAMERIIRNNLSGYGVQGNASMPFDKTSQPVEDRFASLPEEKQNEIIRNAGYSYDKALEMLQNQ